ncbi:MAG: hypothetical protein HYX88_04120 [Chloroflexi bacterium]|nr:hypothetical protein [Chloroflexota bacterium]
MVDKTIRDPFRILPWKDGVREEGIPVLRSAFGGLEVLLGKDQRAADALAGGLGPGKGLEGLLLALNALVFFLSKAFSSVRTPVYAGRLLFSKDGQLTLGAKALHLVGPYLYFLSATRTRDVFGDRVAQGAAARTELKRIHAMNLSSQIGRIL